MSARRTWTRRAVRASLGTAATAVVVAGIAIGGLRIALMQLPSYQAELEHWAAESLGIGLDYERLDTRLGWRGPEITFHGASVRAPGEAEPFIAARRAAVVVDVWALIATRELRATRLTFEGTDLALRRGADGRLELQRAPQTGGTPDFALLLPADLEVAVRDSRVVYVDAARGVSWAFDDVAVDLQRIGRTLDLHARARPPDVLGSRIEVAAQGRFGADGGWRVFAEVTAADLAELASAVPDLPVDFDRGRGNAAVWLEWSDGELIRGMLDASFAGVAWGEDREEQYERLGVSAGWLRAGPGWRVMLNDVEIVREGRAWASNADTVLELERANDGTVAGLTVQSTFFRIEDLSPLVALFTGDEWADEWTRLAPRGDVMDLDLAVQRRGDGVEYAVSGRIDRLSVAPSARLPGVAGLSAEVRADSDSGRVLVDASAVRFDWPALFRSPLAFDAVSGLFVWRQGADGLRIVNDDLTVANADATVRSSLELTLPHDGGGAFLDLSSQVDRFEAVAAKRYLPAHKMPGLAVEWLDAALQGGTVTDAELTFVGPLAAFPFDRGEGTFRVTADIAGGVLAYARDWPVAQNLDGALEFVNASFSARGSGRVLGNYTDEARVDIADLRRAVLSLETTTAGPLEDVIAFLKQAPQISRQLGPGYDRVEARAGEGRVTLALALPLLDMRAYTLDASLAMTNGTLALEGVGPTASEIYGTLEFAEGVATSDRLDAIFLDGPVTARVSAPPTPGYRARVDVEGEVAGRAVAEAFGLPLDDLVAGQARWRGDVLLPATRSDDGDAARATAAPLRVNITSNLSGLALYLPTPFRKEPGEPTGLELELVFGAGGLEARGHVGATRRFDFALAAGDDGLELEHAVLTLGGASPAAPVDGGLAVYGTVPKLDFDAWAALVRAHGSSGQPSGLAASGLGKLFVEAQLDVGDFTAFGQQVGAARLAVQRAATEWQIDIDSAPVAGVFRVPRHLAGRPAIAAELERLYLTPGSDPGVAAANPVNGKAARPVDPRRLLGIDLTANEFAFGMRRFGKLRADVRADPRGLRLVSFESEQPSFKVTGRGGWYAGARGQTTQLTFDLQATDVARALMALSLEPVASGKAAMLSGNVQWPGAPTDDWMGHLGGQLALRLTDGSLLDIDPGAGRVVGLMSITALPRRLALDFRDVFNKGFVFDELAGQFDIIDGNAYTDNLKVTGPVAEIGVAGRIGLRARDYRQQAIVTAEPGKMLPTVGGLLAGPGVGAALLIFTRIFKEPLKGIGRASYCVTGTWDEPLVERLSAEQLERGPLCADLPDGAIE